MSDEQGSKSEHQPSGKLIPIIRRNLVFQGEKRSAQSGLVIQCNTSVRAWESGNPDSLVYERQAHWAVTSSALNSEPTVRDAVQPIMTERSNHVAETPINAEKSSEPEPSSFSIPGTVAAPKLARDNSADTLSSNSKYQQTRTSRVTHRATKLTITSTELRNRPGCDETVSQSSLNTAPTDRDSRTSCLRRPSLGWDNRVSVNTPQRRVSEKEVVWVGQDEADTSSTSSSEDTLFSEIRPSIFVNMDVAKGNRISISLAKLDEEMKEYLAHEFEEADSV